MLLASLIALAVIVFSYWSGQQTYKETAEFAQVEDRALGEMQIDWAALRAKNPDIAGWIYVPNTVINYPIVQGEDDEKYLTVDFLGGQGQVTHFGTVFLSAANTKDFSDKNNIIYGHNMNDGSMFSAFAGWLETESFNENRTIYILTPEKNYRLQTFSVFVCSPYDPLAQVSFSDDDAFVSYIQDKLDRSEARPYPAAPEAKSIEQSFTFVTCTSSYEDNRVILYAYPEETVEMDSSQSYSGSSSSDVDLFDTLNDKEATEVGQAIKELE